MGPTVGTASLSLATVSATTRKALWDQVNWVSTRARETRGLVYFPPSIGWSIPSVQRPHHLARAFATCGFVVVFDCRNANDAVFGFKEVEPGIFLFKAPAELLRELPVTLVWCFVYNIPFRLDVTASAPLVYDIIDTLDVFPYERTVLEENHAWALTWADVVTCVSRELLQDVACKRPDALYLPNAVEAWRFVTHGVAMPEDPALKPFLAAGGPDAPAAGYCGSLARWFDFDFLLQVTELLPHWRFLIIGPHLDEEGQEHPLFCAPNVFSIGPRPYTRLAFYMQHYHVGMNPFRRGEFLRGLSPLKLYENLAAGKPMVVTPFPEAQGIPGVFMADTPASFAASLEQATKIAKDPSFVAHMRGYARKHSWLVRVQEVLARVFPQKLAGTVAHPQQPQAVGTS